MSRFQFILVGVATLCMVGCVFVPPASAAYIGYTSCTDLREPRPLNVTALEVTPYPTQVGGAAVMIFILQFDNTFQGRISLFEITQSGLLHHFYPFCQLGCPPPHVHLVVNLPALTGQQFIVRILNEENHGDCIYFDTRGGNPMLKPEAIPTANLAAITMAAI